MPRIQHRRLPSAGITLGSSLPARIGDWTGVGNEYFVDPAGSDISGTGAVGSPWQTIQKAIDSYAIPGTGNVRINVNPGTYRKAGTTAATQATATFSSLGARSPTSSHVLIVAATDPGTKPIIQEPDYTGASPALSESHGIWLDDSTAKFIRFKNLKLELNTPELNQHQGVRGDDGVTDIDMSGMEFSGWRAANVGSSRAQGIFTQIDRLHLYNSIFHDIGDLAAEADDASHPVYVSAGADDCVFANLLMYDNRNGYGIQFFSGGTGGTGHIVTNITSDNAHHSGGVVDGAFNVKVYNSIFSNNDQFALRVWGGATVDAKYNLTYLNVSAGTLGDGYEDSGAAAFTVSNRLLGDPKYSNYAAKNFHLQTGSPAHNAGDANYTPTTDLEGSVRVLPTVGAYKSPDE